MPEPVWAILLALLALWVAARIGLFDLSAIVDRPTGAVRLPATYAGVDHPFHVARAETLRQSLAEGRLLRWVDHHQGGYPVEFYPLGVAWLEVAVWALALGALSMSAVHKIVVGLIFLLPGLAYLLMAKRDRWPLGVALAAFAGHVAVPGAWWHGGYTELVQWGLVTNVAASVALLFVLLWLTAFVEDGRGGPAAAAGLAAAAAVYTNPRSLVALAVIGGGVWLAAVGRPVSQRPAVRVVSARIALAGGLSALLAAPELLSLLRFADLYEFVHYTGYADPAAFLRSALTAVSTPIFVLGLAGAAVAWRLSERPVTRAAGTTVVLYAVATLILAGGSGEGSPIRQLEATRLMPLQRLLTIYLAAVALHLLLRWLTAALGLRSALLADALLVCAVGLLLVGFVAPAGGAAPDPAAAEPPPRGLYPVVTAAVASQADLREAVQAAATAARPGTALLVIGSALSWHQQLWAPLWTDRPLFYDNWLWLWHPRHAGPPGYDHQAGHHYPLPELALDRAYLDRHGIGAVIVTGPTAAAARAAPALELIRAGDYDVHSVRQPTTIVTLGGMNAATSEPGNQRIVASGASSGGEALIRRTWHPRWRAWVNGQPASIERTADGYMAVPVPAGAVRLELAYGVDAGDWLARTAAAVGVIAVGAVVVGVRPPTLRRSEPSA